MAARRATGRVLVAGLLATALLLGAAGCNPVVGGSGAGGQADKGPRTREDGSDAGGAGAETSGVGDAGSAVGGASPAAGLAGGSAAAAPRALDLERALALNVDLGLRRDQAGRTSEHVGGISDGGPTLLAASDSGDLYLFDAARSRIIQYRGGKAVRFLEVPFVQDPEEMRLDGNRLTLTTRVGLVLDVSGAAPRILEAGWRQGGGGEPGLDHPVPWASLDKGARVQLGMDAGGNLYELVAGESSVLRRLAPDGRELAAVSLAGVEPVQDFSFTPGGAAYALAWNWDSQLSVRVYRLMDSLPQVSGGVEGDAADRSPDWSAPTAFSRPMPKSLRVTSEVWPAFTIRDPVVLQNLWWLLSGEREAPQVPADAEVPFPRGTFNLNAEFTTGGPLRLAVNETGATVGGPWFYQGGAWQLLRAEAFRAAGGLEPMLEASSVQVELADVPGYGRTLSVPERSELARLAGDAFRVTGAEPPDPLDPAYPRYRLKLKGPGWETTLTVLEGGYACLGGAAGWQSNFAGMFVGGVPDLQPWLERVLPAPVAKPGDLAYLYGADRLSIGVDGGPANALTHWQRTVARLLLGAARKGTDWMTEVREVRLTFLVDGEDQVVVLDHGGFDYGGRRYDRPGLVSSIVGLQGVP